MRILIDSHILLWYSQGNKKLKTKYIELINNEENEIFVSLATLWEIALKHSIGKLKLNGSFKTLVTQLKEHGFQILQIDTEDLEEIIELPFHHQDPFDRVIIAQSRTKNIPLISEDDKFGNYDVVLL